MSNRPTILYITDLYYQARNRQYYTEDLYITAQLKEDFDIALCHPLHTQPFEEVVDLMIIRNSGPTIYYKEYFQQFFERVNKKGLRVYNALNGKGDMLGKSYLLQLTQQGFPVIPTIDSVDAIALLPPANLYMVKPIEGADSIGARTVTQAELPAVTLGHDIIQPFIDFQYEVSFYFIDAVFQYALYAPNKQERWNLQSYHPTLDDLAFANRFIQWNTMSYGIQRVDACRTKDGRLLLVELEDLNPFLSLDLLDEKTRNSFIEAFRSSIQKVLKG